VGHRQWVDAALRMIAMARDDRWSESVAVGSEQFVEQVKTELRSAVGRRQIAAENKMYTLREPSPPYDHLFDGNNEALSQNNAYLWDTILDSANT
jgi:putative transposase